MEEDWANAFYSKKILPEDEPKVAACRDAFAALAKVLQDQLPQGRYRSMVKTLLEQTASMATKAFSHRT